MSGKGSAPRPYSVPKETFNAAFYRIFKTPRPGAHQDSPTKPASSSPFAGYTDDILTQTIYKAMLSEAPSPDNT